MISNKFLFCPALSSLLIICCDRSRVSKPKVKAEDGDKWSIGRSGMSIEQVQEVVVDFGDVHKNEQQTKEVSFLKRNYNRCNFHE